jgi:hypothetical protein
MTTLRRINNVRGSSHGKSSISCIIGTPADWRSFKCDSRHRQVGELGSVARRTMAGVQKQIRNHHAVAADGAKGRGDQPIDHAATSPDMCGQINDERPSHAWRVWSAFTF